MDHKPVNGHPPQTPLEAAQQRLAHACTAMPMNPVGAAISAYVNSTLASARIDALCDLWVNPPNGSYDRQEAMDAALVRHLNRRAEQLEADAVKARNALQVAQSADVGTAVRQTLSRAN